MSRFTNCFDICIFIFLALASSHLLAQHSETAKAAQCVAVLSVESPLNEKAWNSLGKAVQFDSFVPEYLDAVNAMRETPASLSPFLILSLSSLENMRPNINRFEIGRISALLDIALLRSILASDFVPQRNPPKIVDSLARGFRILDSYVIDSLPAVAVGGFSQDSPSVIRKVDEEDQLAVAAEKLDEAVQYIRVLIYEVQKDPRFIPLIDSAVKGSLKVRAIIKADLASDSSDGLWEKLLDEHRKKLRSR